MADGFLGEIRIMAFGFVPSGWAICDGRLLSINQNQALYSLLGTTYGGNGSTTFGLPDLRGKVPVHFNASHPQGQTAGEKQHALTVQEMPSHTHTAYGSGSTANLKSASGNLLAASASNPYSSTQDVSMHAQAISATGNNQGHENMSPYLAVNYVIALVGIYPSRD